MTVVYVVVALVVAAAAINRLAETTLRAVVGRRNLDETLSDASARRDRAGRRQLSPDHTMTVTDDQVVPVGEATEIAIASTAAKSVPDGGLPEESALSRMAVAARCHAG